MNSFGKRLNAVLKEKGLSQVQLAEMTGIKQGTISNWINNRYLPKIDKQIILAKALNVDIQYLLGNPVSSAQKYSPEDTERFMKICNDNELGADFMSADELSINTLLAGSGITFTRDIIGSLYIGTTDEDVRISDDEGNRIVEEIKNYVSYLLKRRLDEHTQNR